MAPHRESQTAESVTSRLTPHEKLTRGERRGLRLAFGGDTYAANLRPAVAAFSKVCYIKIDEPDYHNAVTREAQTTLAAGGSTS